MASYARQSQNNEDSKVTEDRGVKTNMFGAKYVMWFEVGIEQCRTNIRIYSDIRIFVSEYWIFEYEYQNFDFSNIFIFVFDQKLCFVKGEYTSIFVYSKICLRILDIRI
jgi:hypothetical protein